MYVSRSTTVINAINAAKCSLDCACFHLQTATLTLRGLYIFKHVHAVCEYFAWTWPPLRERFSKQVVKEARSQEGVWFVDFKCFCKSEVCRVKIHRIISILITRGMINVMNNKLEQQTASVRKHACTRTCSTSVPFAHTTTSVILGGVAAKAAVRPRRMVKRKGAARIVIMDARYAVLDRKLMDNCLGWYVTDVLSDLSCGARPRNSWHYVIVIILRSATLCMRSKYCIYMNVVYIYMYEW